MLKKCNCFSKKEGFHGKQCDIFDVGQLTTEEALKVLLNWAVGNDGPKDGNPYGIPAVKIALKVLARQQGLKPESYLDAKLGVQVES